MKFINRTQETSFLKSEFSNNNASLIIIYGKRRVGKTELIKHFCKNKNYIYFLGRQVGNKDNLQQLSETCATKFKQPLLENQPFKSWDDFFNFLIRNTKKKTIIAFDEYPYFVSSQPGLSSIFQQYWDEKLKRNKNIKLILCG
ncbi:ATP-binding protein, partial [Patescibacteria group bacterium]|nr:ATP-binding protein [Patescibacteria group bacterium]